MWSRFSAFATFPILATTIASAVQGSNFGLNLRLKECCKSFTGVILQRIQKKVKYSEPKPNGTSWYCKVPKTLIKSQTPQFSIQQPSFNSPRQMPKKQKFPHLLGSKWTACEATFGWRHFAVVNRKNEDSRLGDTCGKSAPDRLAQYFLSCIGDSVASAVSSA